MLSQVLLVTAASLVTVSSLATGPVSAGPPHGFACYAESSELHCYNSGDDTPQNVTVADVAYIANYLRLYGRQVKDGRLFAMTAATAPDCAEWSLYARKSALALAKHVETDKNSAVLFEDIANTIDGGAKATDPQKAAAIIGCLSSGGSLGVQVDKKRAVYSSDAYKKAGYTPNGVLVKVVANLG